MSGPKRETDVAAAKMGELLLKGYRMLDACCAYCSTVLMQDRYGKNTCVLCGSEEAQLRNVQQQLQEQHQQQQQQQHQLAREGMDTDDEDCNAVGQGRRGLSSASNTKILAAMNDIISEVKYSAQDLSSHRVSESDADFSKRQKILEHIKLCTEIIKDLKELQN